MAARPESLTAQVPAPTAKQARVAYDLKKLMALPFNGSPGKWRPGNSHPAAEVARAKIQETRGLQEGGEDGPPTKVTAQKRP